VRAELDQIADELDRQAAATYTADQMETAIARAIHDRKFKVVESLIKMLAVQDPGRAQAVLDAINLGFQLRRECREVTPTLEAGGQQ
jgi:hypothetical protein